MLEGPIVLRMDDKDFAEAATTPVPRGRGAGAAGAASTRRSRRAAAHAALRRSRSSSTRPKASSRSSTAAATAIMAAGGSDLSWQQQRTDGGTIFPTGDGLARRRTPARACRASRSRSSTTTGWCGCSTKGVPVKVELNVETKFYDETDAERLQHDRRDSRAPILR